MSKYQLMAEKVLVTFVEAAVAYFVVIPSPGATKTVIAGAVGAGLSAVYNLLRESTPTLTALSVPSIPPVVISPEPQQIGQLPQDTIIPPAPSAQPPADVTP